MILLLALLACREAEEPPHTLETVLAISETASGRELFVDWDEGTYVGELCLSELLPDQCAVSELTVEPPCLLFGAEPQPEGSWLLSAAFRVNLDYMPSAILGVRLDQPTTPEWTVDGISFAGNFADYAPGCVEDPDAEIGDCHLSSAHGALWDGEELLVADTVNSRALWLQVPDGGGTAEILRILGPDHAEWQSWRNLNHMQLLEEDGRTLLLTTFKSSLQESWTVDLGRIVLWDITDRDAPSLVWAWPESGPLAAPHHAEVQTGPEGERWLVWAHSLGASEDPDNGVYGSLGFARWEGLSPPTYLGDGVLEDGEDPLGFVRDLRVNEEGELLITDSGCENKSADCELPGRVLRGRVDPLEPADESGAWGDQRLLEVETEDIAYDRQLTFPYTATLYDAGTLDLEDIQALGPCGD